MLSFKTNFQTKLTHWRAVAGLDFHVLVTLLFRSWAVAAGGVTIILLPLWLNPTEQGYYFTFASVLALQIFFELGLNQIIMQLVSHETAHLTETKEGRLSGPPEHLGRLISLARLIKIWYGWAAILFAVVGGAAGIAFFMQKTSEPISFWLGIWIVLVGATAVNLWLSPGLAVMEGCGKVGQVARLRLVQSVLGYTMLWTTLSTGAGLWATIAVPIASAACTLYWLRVHGNMLNWLSNHVIVAKNQLSWRLDVFPLQWRIAVSWASGYLIFNLFTPMVFSRQGPVEAGRLGMALTLFTAISTIGMSWVNAKAPNFTAHIARSEQNELAKLFKSVLIRSTTVITLLSGCVLLIIWYMKITGYQEVHRIASFNVMIVLAFTTIANSVIFSMAVYMRAHREEPMLTQSIVAAILVSIVVYFGSTYGTFTMMFLYMLTSLSILLPWTIFLFLKFSKKKLHHL